MTTVIHNSCNYVVLRYSRISQCYNILKISCNHNNNNTQLNNKDCEAVVCEEQLYLGRARSRAAPSPVGSSASVCLRRAPPPPPAEEETWTRRPSGRRMTGSVSEVPRHTPPPAWSHTNRCLVNLTLSRSIYLIWVDIISAVLKEWDEASWN